jgi:Asp-tRNA(Asn)/Glu-tRNA(Gln) amidotransferase A subunit family amidase
VATDPALGARAAEAAAELADAGHEVVELPPSFLADDDWDRMQLVVRARGARDRLRALEALAGRPLDEDDAEPLMFALAARAPEFTEEEADAAGAWQLRYAAEVTTRWQAAALDALVSPTAGVPPQRLDVLVPPDDDPIAIYGWFRRIGAFTGAWNMTGQPALSLPWWTPPADRVPAGVQLVGAVGREDVVLRRAHAVGWRRPDRTAVRRP